MPKEILRYFEGYAKLKLTGLSIEKFINKVQSSDIILLNIKRNKYREVTLEVNRCDLGKVKDTAGQFGLEMEILVFPIILSVFLSISLLLWVWLYVYYSYICQHLLSGRLRLWEIKPFLVKSLCRLLRTWGLNREF